MGTHLSVRKTSDASRCDGRLAPVSATCSQTCERRIIGRLGGAAIVFSPTDLNQVPISVADTGRTGRVSKAKPLAAAANPLARKILKRWERRSCAYSRPLAPIRLISVNGGPL